MTSPRTLAVPTERLARWFENYAVRHGTVEYGTVDGRLEARACDGAVATAALPLGRAYDGPPDVAAFAREAAAPGRWGLLLVRKGGFGVAALDGESMLASKVGQRHVQGRTKAGGQSQQRFARRRENQALRAYQAAADHAYRVLVVEGGALTALVCGGDRQAVDAVLSDARLAGLSVVRTEPWLAVPDPRRAVLDQAAVDAKAVRIRLTEPA
ncbi:MAG TPA: acVLRF1 family peptidyl-tRNA hydrolase [Pseudonocardiaceae bacterium]|nr:acVLRF1 family peptidyl-tRNA hydrolase [Pseudonocardiaceae bacterium]